MAVFVNTVVFIAQYCCGEMWALRREAGILVVGVAASVEPNVVGGPVMGSILVRVLVSSCKCLFELKLVLVV